MAEGRTIAENRKARRNYAIEDTVEAGLVLTGTEVKSLREGRADIAEAYASEEKGEMTLINSYIPEYSGGNQFNHEPRRHRKLLVHKREAERLKMAAQRQGYTIVPLKLYFNKRGYAKILLGLGKGKSQIDKRQDEKKRDWNRQKQRLLRARG